MFDVSSPDLPSLLPTLFPFMCLLIYWCVAIGAAESSTASPGRLEAIENLWTGTLKRIGKLTIACLTEYMNE